MRSGERGRPRRCRRRRSAQAWGPSHRLARLGSERRRKGPWRQSSTQSQFPKAQRCSVPDTRRCQVTAGGLRRPSGDVDLAEARRMPGRGGGALFRLTVRPSTTNASLAWRMGRGYCSTKLACRAFPTRTPHHSPPNCCSIVGGLGATCWGTLERSLYIQGGWSILPSGHSHICCLPVDSHAGWGVVFVANRGD